LGGAIFGHSAAVTIVNSTFTGNYAVRGVAGGDGAANGADAGGAIFTVGGSLTVSSSTIAGNDGTGSGAGLVVYAPTTGESTALDVSNTIVAGNTGRDECFVLSGSGGNLTTTGDANLVAAHDTDEQSPCPGIALTDDPQLGALQLNAPGLTPTMALEETSPAVDAGDVNTSPFDDQRGVPRPQRNAVDIGAYELIAAESDPPSASPTQSPAANVNGWNKGAVTVTWHWSDEPGGSGIDPTACTTSSTSSGEGAGIVLMATCGDYAGNVGTASYTVDVDTTAPVLNPTIAPTTVVVGQAGVTASANATDPTSGVATASCDAVDTSTPGVHSIQCTATDNADNTATARLSYVAQYRILGFFSPVPGSKWLAGQTVPVKVALGDVNGARLPDAQATALAGACRVRFVASGAQSLSAQCLRYDATHDQFVFSWKLGKQPPGPVTISVTVSYPGTTMTTDLSEQITITRK
jgi:hypothetical protein